MGVPGGRREVKKSDEQQGDDSDSEADKDDDRDDASSVSEGGAVMPAENEAPWKGNFHCKLCPNKVILTEAVLKVHLESKAHKKNVAKFMHAKEIGLPAYMQEVLDRQEQEKNAQINGSK